MRRVVYVFAVVAAIAAVLSACNPEAPYSLKNDTKITIKVEQTSAGFVESSFSPSRDVYYLTSLEKVKEGRNPESYEKQFMQLALDSAYDYYLSWRRSLLEQGVPVHQIASFKDHCLEYGKTTYSFYYLEPDTDYWLFAFAVDPETNKAVSRLFLDTIHTLESSKIKCHFRYRIRGTWDYVYPENEKGEILSNFPYSGATVDSLTLRERMVASPAAFFLDSLRTLFEQRNEAQIYTGIIAHNNDGVGNGSSPTVFVEGKTYYTAIAGVDGSLNPDQRAIYRFVWHEGMDTVFTESSRLDETGW